MSYRQLFLSLLFITTGLFFQHAAYALEIEQLGVSGLGYAGAFEAQFARIGGQIWVFSSDEIDGTFHSAVIQDNGSVQEILAGLPATGQVTQVVPYRDSVYMLLSVSGPEGTQVWKTDAQDAFGWQQVTGLNRSVTAIIPTPQQLALLSTTDGVYSAMVTQDGVSWQNKKISGLPSTTTTVDPNGRQQQFLQRGQWTYAVFRKETDDNSDYVLVKRTRNGVRWDPVLRGLFPNKPHKKEVAGWGVVNGALYIATQNTTNGQTQLYGVAGQTASLVDTNAVLGDTVWMMPIKNKMLIVSTFSGTEGLVYSLVDAKNDSQRKYWYTEAHAAYGISDFISYNGSTIYAVSNRTGVRLYRLE